MDIKPEFLMRVESYQAAREVTSAKQRRATLTREDLFVVRDVAARDVQAATSPANRMALARTKSWRFAGGGSGRGEKPTRQRPSLWMANRVGCPVRL